MDPTSLTLWAGQGGAGLLMASEACLWQQGHAVVAVASVHHHQLIMERDSGERWQSHTTWPHHPADLGGVDPGNDQLLQQGVTPTHCLSVSGMVGADVRALQVSNDLEFGDVRTD